MVTQNIVTKYSSIFKKIHSIHNSLCIQKVRNKMGSLKILTSRPLPLLCLWFKEEKCCLIKDEETTFFVGLQIFSSVVDVDDMALP